MAYVLRLVGDMGEPPSAYPPPDPDDPSAYPVRFINLDMLVRASVALGGVADQWHEDDPVDESRPDLVPAYHYFDVGRVVPAHLCRPISQCMKPLIEGGVPPELFEALRGAWNAIQREFRAQAEARGEVVISGLEPFPYDPQGLRNDLVHWGFFHALATGYGGFEVEG